MQASELLLAPEDKPTAAPTPGKVRLSIRMRWLVLALLSGITLWLCHFPVAWGWLAWVGMVPVLALTRVQSRGWWWFLCAWFCGLAYYVPAISWMSVAHEAMIACWLMLSVYCSLYFPLSLWLVRRLERGTRLPLMLTFPAVWTALEFFRTFFGTGFSWYLLAHTQHDFLPIIQIADLGGAFAVSFLVALVNVVVFEGLMRIAAVRRVCGVENIFVRCRRRYLAQVGCAACLSIAALVYGMVCISHDQFERGPRIALLQGSIDQRLRNEAAVSARASDLVQKKYSDLSKSASQFKPRPDLIVWPETSFPGRWAALDPKIDLRNESPDLRMRLAVIQGLVRQEAIDAKTNVLLGVNTDVLLPDRSIIHYNSALLLDAQGHDLKRYDKIHRVPFGEYIPFRDWLPIMNVFSPYGDYDYSIRVGDGLTRFKLGEFNFGVLICYEDTDPALARDFAIATPDGPPVDFLLNISNDGWFDGTAEHEEHLAISRFRAIESRRALARSVNMGVSAVVDSNGRVLAPEKRAGTAEVWSVPADAAALGVGQWHGYKKVEGILEVTMPIDHRTSVYAMYGDWLPYGCWVLVFAGLAWGWVGRRTKAADATA